MTFLSNMCVCYKNCWLLYGTVTKEITNATRWWQSAGKDRNTNLILSLYYGTISESRYQQLYIYTDKRFWNFGTLQLYRSHSCVWGDGWEPPWIPCGDVSWLPGGADNISLLNYTQYRTQLNFTTSKDNIFWTNGGYSSASSPNTCKYPLAHSCPNKISYSPQALPDTCHSTKLQCHNPKDYDTGW